MPASFLGKKSPAKVARKGTVCAIGLQPQYVETVVQKLLAESAPQNYSSVHINVQRRDVAIHEDDVFAGVGRARMEILVIQK